MKGKGEKISSQRERELLEVWARFIKKEGRGGEIQQKREFKEERGYPCFYVDSYRRENSFRRGNPTLTQESKNRIKREKEGIKR